MWYVYILLCDGETFYTGITNNLKKRIEEHKNKKSFFTKKFFQLKLVYFEKIISKSIAAKREKQIKGWSRAKKILLIKKQAKY
jgi:putative endonuclease